MSKPEINIPAEFAPDGTKTPFSSSKVQYGFDRLNPDILAGDNLNQFIDDTYKGLNGVLELYDEKVNKTGDTMTGVLKLEYPSANDGSPIVIKSSNLDFDNPPSTTVYPPFIQFVDMNGNRMGQLEYCMNSNGSHFISINDKQDSQTSTYASLVIGWDSNSNKYCQFPNTQCVDGQWVSADSIIVSDQSLNGSTNLSYTLSSVPNDGANYEVLLSGYCTTDSTSGHSIAILVSSDLITSQLSLCATRTRTNSTMSARGSVILPISSTRKIYVNRDSAYNGTMTLYLRGYRRIGINR